MSEGKKVYFAAPSNRMARPCPFCGRVDIMTPDGGALVDGPYRVMCHTCRSSGPAADEPADAVELWNKRLRIVED